MLLSSFELPFPVFLGAMPVLGQTMFCTVHKADVILTVLLCQVKIKLSKGNHVDTIGYYYYLLVILLKKALDEKRSRVS